MRERRKSSRRVGGGGEDRGRKVGEARKSTRKIGKERSKNPIRKRSKSRRKRMETIGGLDGELRDK